MFPKRSSIASFIRLIPLLLVLIAVVSFAIPGVLSAADPRIPPVGSSGTGSADADAAGDSIAKSLCFFVQMLTGKFMLVIVTGVIIFIGIMALWGKMQHTMIIVILVACGVILTAGTITQKLASAMGVDGASSFSCKNILNNNNP